MTGWALRLGPPDLDRAGTWTLATDAELRKARKNPFGCRDADPRMKALLGKLRALVPIVERVVWEDVEFSSSTAQTQLWASFRGILWSVLADNPTVHAWPVPVGTLKKWATGSGAADKDRMRAAWLGSPFRAQMDTPVETLDDNAIDAAWLLNYAENNKP